MEKEIITVAILGCGSRGNAYGGLMYGRVGGYEIVSLCDCKQIALEKTAKKFGVDPSLTFLDENEFFAEKRADLLIISTLDKDHVRQCLRALQLGYDVLLEKPITDSEEECYALLDAQKKYGGRVFVCHVLRYAPAFVMAKKLLKEGAIGRLVDIEALEQVGYWHQAHSYVRGNWRRSEDTTPMIMAKCCHDLDLLQYYADSKCKSVSSIGDLSFFNAQNAPEGSADRCVDCKYVDTCPYSARRCYVERWKLAGSAKDAWPYNVITPEYPLTEEAIEKAIATTPYGRCAFKCDNDVVDHQVTIFTFDNGVKASLTMVAFTSEVGRIITFRGTYGEIVLNETLPYLELKRFGEKVERIELEGCGEECGFAHGGGDAKMIAALHETLSSKDSGETTLAASIESHLMSIAAEKSRVLGGERILVHPEV